MDTSLLHVGIFYTNNNIALYETGKNGTHASSKERNTSSRSTIKLDLCVIKASGRDKKLQKA